MGRRLIFKRSLSFLSFMLLLKLEVYSVLSAISSGYPHLKGRLPTRYSPVRHSRKEASFFLAVRLACLRRAASVRSEPGSNSPLFYFKYPEGYLISIILSKSRFLFLGTLTLRKKKNTRKKQYPLALFSSPFSLFYAYFPYQRFLLFGFFFFPFPLFSKTITLKAAHVYCSKREILYTHFVSFVKPLFHFFSFLFFHQL